KACPTLRPPVCPGRTRWPAGRHLKTPPSAVSPICLIPPPGRGRSSPIFRGGRLLRRRSLPPEEDRAWWLRICHSRTSLTPLLPRFLADGVVVRAAEEGSVSQSRRSRYRSAFDNRSGGRDFQASLRDTMSLISPCSRFQATSISAVQSAPASARSVASITPKKAR